MCGVPNCSVCKGQKLCAKCSKSIGLLHGEQTLADHAEQWWREQGKRVPKRNTRAWNEMFLSWHQFAFEGFPESR